MGFTIPCGPALTHDYIQVLPKGSALEALWRANKLDEELYRSSAVLVSLDALVWSAAAAESRVPLEVRCMGVVCSVICVWVGGGVGGACRRKK